MNFNNQRGGSDHGRAYQIIFLGSIYSGSGPDRVGISESEWVYVVFHHQIRVSPAHSDLVFLLRYLAGLFCHDDRIFSQQNAVHKKNARVSFTVQPMT